MIRRQNWPPPKLAETHFQHNGYDELESINNLIRGSIIARMDELYTDGQLGKLLWRDHADPVIRARGLEVFQSMMLALFPEEFADPNERHPPGVIPHAGPRRVGTARMRRYAELVEAKG